MGLAPCPAILGPLVGLENPHRQMSDFILENAVTAAQEVIARESLADQTLFVLPKQQWDAFCAALDARPKRKPALKRLLTEAGLFDEQR